MAVKLNATYFTFFYLSLTFLFTSGLPRENPITQTVLDVKASLELAHSVLSLNPESLDSFSQSQTQTQSKVFFSLPLHPRRSSGHDTYRSLLLARLARDSARVDSVNARVGLALEGVKRSELKPSAEAEEWILPEAAVSTPVVSGTSEGSGEYFTRVGVGSPARQFSMVIDTGSDVNWLQCNPCTECYRQSDPVFDPATSSSFSRLSCSSPQCSALDTSGCRANSCLYQVAYGDGSYTVGDFVTETISFGSSGEAKGVALGCGHDNEGLFIGAAGLVGLGGGELSLTNQIKATSFSYCLVNRDSAATSTLDFNSAAPSDSVLAQILRNRKVDTFYYVQIDGIFVGGKLISAAADASVFAIDESGNGGIIVDSGTAVTRLRAPVYESLRDSFRALTRDLPLTDAIALFDTCYDLSSRTSVRVPTVSFRLSGGKVWQLPAKNYLIPVDNAGTFCLAFAPTKSSLSIIGNVQQQGTRVSYDLASNRVGFSPNKC